MMPSHLDTAIARVTGLHHVTAIASDPQRNVEFYTEVLGLRLVKRTVNFDDLRTWHLYYGDESGSPGSLITFFPWPDAGRGRQGPEQVGVTSFAIVPEAFGAWIARLLRLRVEHDRPTRRRVGSITESVIALRDPDGLLLEIVTHPSAEAHSSWGGAPGMAAEHAIRGLHSVTLWEEDAGPTGRVLRETLGFRELADVDGVHRFEGGAGGAGTFVNVRAIGGFMRGREGPGTVHHVAFRAPDDAAELTLRQQVTLAGMLPTAPVDRRYFRSVYFREPGGVLCEVATDEPGFTIDEPLDRLGTKLQLPPWLEAQRNAIGGALPALDGWPRQPRSSASESGGRERDDPG